MARNFHPLLTVLLLTLSLGICQSRLIPNDAHLDGATKWQVLKDRAIFARQNQEACIVENADPEAPLCVPLCAPESSACSLKPAFDKRDIEYGIDLSAVGNVSHVATQTLEKRAFAQLTQAEVETYVPLQFNITGYYGVVQPLVQLSGRRETDATVVREIEFGSTRFSVGARMIHGCTMVTIVSDRRVYMGHFWEPNWWAQTDGRDWQEHVRNWFRGGPIYPTAGPQLDAAKYPANDRTRVYIMHPRRAQTVNAANYVYKMNSLRSAIKAGLNYPDVPMVVFYYARLDYDIPEEWNLRHTQRGHALFQYDPTGSPTNDPSWRLFYEHHRFTSEDPPVMLPNGIPD